MWWCCGWCVKLRIQCSTRRRCHLVFQRQGPARRREATELFRRSLPTHYQSSSEWAPSEWAPSPPALSRPYAAMTQGGGDWPTSSDELPIGRGPVESSTAGSSLLLPLAGRRVQSAGRESTTGQLLFFLSLWWFSLLWPTTASPQPLPATKPQPQPPSDDLLDSGASISCSSFQLS